MKKTFVISGITAALLAFVLSGACKSGPEMVMLPMTPMLIEEVGADNMSKLSYFLSKEVSLERQDMFRENMIFEKGVAVRVDKDVRETIKIDTNTPGAAGYNELAQVSHVNFRVLGIEFEGETTTKIGFAVPLANPDGFFDLLFDDDDTGTIEYGPHIYRVIYKGADRPYLMVKVARNIVREELIRKASGKPLD
ncbi:MAG: hypothetical protein LBG72_07920 [Spirochaetaceae bacterium]|jgi:hypothetical protein|nr:hypothetical protein [Spirochaetaceae bacterium]